MRTMIIGAALIATTVTLGGCAHSRGIAQPVPSRVKVSQNVPVVLEPPKLSDRRRVDREREAERAAMANTEVHGHLKSRKPVY